MSGSEFRNPMEALVVSSVRRLMGDTSIGIDHDFFTSLPGLALPRWHLHASLPHGYFL
jgi:hypothetical protein